MIQFHIILEAAIAPLVLISGVGLLLLSLTNRYNHAIDRTRAINLEILKTDASHFENLQAQQKIIYKRCKILKRSIGFIVISVLLSSILILLNVASVLFKIHLDVPGIILLVVSILCISFSSFLLFMDVSLSLKALTMENERITISAS